MQSTRPGMPHPHELVPPEAQLQQLRLQPLLHLAAAAVHFCHLWQQRRARRQRQGGSSCGSRGRRRRSGSGGGEAARRLQPGQAVEHRELPGGQRIGEGHIQLNLQLGEALEHGLQPGRQCSETGHPDALWSSMAMQ